MRRFLIILVVAIIGQLPGASSGLAEDLQKFEGCQLVEQPWSDGDSFQVRLPDQKEITVRLYGADCLEMHLDGDDSNARRLRDQRRYFGIQDITVAKGFGEKARGEVARLLAKPFTIHTAFADGRGDGRFNRVYGFVTLPDGKDLASHLVETGMARAFGVSRLTPDGTTAKEYMARLRDLELGAAKKGNGAWSATDWQRLPEERKQAREEEEEIELAKGNHPLEGKINPNKAGRDELMKLPGIGEVLANRIIQAREHRKFSKPDDLREVNGIGEALLAKIQPHLDF